MKSTQIDWLNIGLMLLSLILALKIPFELFLFSYAVLGPLHYLTEINWLKEKNYFSKSNKVFWVMLTLAILEAANPVINALAEWSLTAPYLTSWPNSTVNLLLYEWSPNFIFIGLFAGISFAVFKKNWISYVVIVVVTVLGYFIMKQDLFKVWMGAFLPTLIHVYIFTGLFMLYGALKTKSTPGIISVVALIACAFLIANYNFTKLPEVSKETFMIWDKSTFQGLTDAFTEFFHIEKERTLESTRTILRIQAFIAFAYTYHYLNWFSKTSIIKWHQVSKKELALIGGFWAFSVGLYYYDYHVGLTVLFLLSFFHVFLEFPLNVQSIKGIVQSISIKGKS
ncbi:MAG: hypothetical protein NT150_11765 [Bacteroidetes bacterium]|nr:hypothetical protein [Bacteroidota bacterium]